MIHVHLSANLYREFLIHLYRKPDNLNFPTFSTYSTTSLTMIFGMPLGYEDALWIQRGNTSHGHKTSYLIICQNPDTILDMHIINM